MNEPTRQPEPAPNLTITWRFPGIPGPDALPFHPAKDSRGRECITLPMLGSFVRLSAEQAAKPELATIFHIEVNSTELAGLWVQELDFERLDQ